MKATALAIPDVLIIEPKVFGDERGFFFESFNRRQFAELIGRNVDFVQDNHSRSAKNVLRGLHYQIQQPQGRLVRVVQGTVFFSIKPPITGRQNSSAALLGTTPLSVSNGPSRANPACPQRTNKPFPWQKRKTSHD